MSNSDEQVNYEEEEIYSSDEEREQDYGDDEEEQETFFDFPDEKVQETQTTTQTFKSDEGIVGFSDESEKEKFRIQEVPQNIITIYSANDRSSVITVCGAVSKIPATFWKKLDNLKIEHEYNDRELCYKITFNDPEKDIDKFLTNKKLFLDWIDKENLNWSFVDRGVVALSKKPFEADVLMMCGNVNEFPDNIKEELSKWAGFNPTSNCWEFNKKSRDLVANFMRGHGWTVYNEGEEFVNAKDTTIVINKFGKGIPKQKHKTKLVGATKSPAKKMHYQLGDTVSWTDQDGLQYGTVEQADTQYFSVRNSKTEEVLPAIKQQEGELKMFKVVGRNHTFDDFPIQSPITSDSISRGRVVGYDVANSLLIIETYEGDQERISIKDPSLKHFKIDTLARSSSYKPGMNVKYRVAGTKDWVTGQVSTVLEDAVVVRTIQTKVRKEDQGIIYKGSKFDQTTGQVVSVRTNQIDFELADDMSGDWSVGDEIFFTPSLNKNKSVENEEEYRLQISAFRPNNRRYMIASVYDNTVLTGQKVVIPIDCLSLTIIPNKDISKTGFLNFGRKVETEEELTAKIRKYIRGKFEILIKEHYPALLLSDAVKLEDNLNNKNSNRKSYLDQSLLLILALDPNDTSVGQYAVFFRSHVQSKLFKFDKLHKATIDYILPEMTDNPNLDENQYSDATTELHDIVKWEMEDILHQLNYQKNKQIRPLKRDPSAHVPTIDNYVLKDIHSLCSNVGSREIPTESLVLCFDDGAFYCFSVHDIVKNIQKADADGNKPINPFTEHELDDVFVRRVREMFMNTDSGRKHLSELPEANRDYNLVEGEVIPNKIIVQHPKGVTISELMAIDTKLRGQPLTNDAWELLQKLAIYTIQKINIILGSTGFFETESIVRAVAVWLEHSPALKQELLPHIGRRLNKITPKNLKDVDSQYYKYHVYTEELMQVEKNYGHGISANIKGLSVYGIVIFSILQILLKSLIQNNEVITDQMIKEQIRAESDLRVLYAGELPYESEEEKMEDLFGTPTSSPEGSPSGSPQESILKSPQESSVSGETQQSTALAKKFHAMMQQPSSVISISGETQKMYNMHTVIVKNFYAMKPSLLTSKLNRKETIKLFDDTAGHNLYKIIIIFIRGVFNTNEETGKIIKESMLTMVITYLKEIMVSHNCYEMILSGAKAYMKTDLKDVPVKNKQIITRSQASLITIMKSEKISRVATGEALGVLLFSLGSLISCILSDSKKSGIITGKNITDEVDGDDDLKKFLITPSPPSKPTTTKPPPSIPPPPSIAPLLQRKPSSKQTKSIQNMKSLSKKSTMDFREKNIDLDWDVESLQDNPNLSMSFVNQHPEFAWDRDFLYERFG